MFPTRWFEGALETCGFTLKRFFFVIVCALIGTGVSEWAIAMDTPEAWEFMARPLLVCLLGIPLLFLLAMVREASAKRWPLELLGVGLLLLYGVTLPPNPQKWPQDILIRFFLFLSGACFLATVAPFLIRRHASAFWDFNQRLFVSLFWTAICVGVLVVGLEIALQSIHMLFDVQFEKAFAEVFAGIVGVLGTILFLAGVPRDFENSPVAYPSILRKLVQFAFVPLIVAYTAILYAYGAKIVGTMTWPRGGVALPVLALACVGFAGAALLHPLRSEPEERWASRYFRWFFPVLAPLAVLLLASFWVRISEYGITEERYLGIVAGIWILAGSLVFAFNQNAGIRWMPASLAALCLLAALGPWSAPAVSARSQIARLDVLLQKTGLLKDGRLVRAEKRMDRKDYESVSDVIRYLSGHHGDAALIKRFGDLEPMKKADWAKKDYYDKASLLLSWLKIEPIESSDYVSAFIDQKLSLPIEGWKGIYSPGMLYENSTREYGNLKLSFKKGTLSAALGKDAPEPVFLDHFKRIKPGAHPALEMFVDWPEGNPAYRIFFKHITLSTSANGEAKIRSLEVIVLEK